VQRFGAAKDMTRGAGWCFGGLVVLGALLRLIVEALGVGGIVLGVPLGIVALGLLLVGGLCALCAPLLWLAALLARRRRGTVRVDDGLVVDEGSLTSVFPLVSVAGARISPFEDAIVFQMRDGDVIHAAIGSFEEGDALLDAVAAGTVRGTWLGSLHPRREVPSWAQWPWLTSAGAAIFGFVVGSATIDGSAALAVAVLAFAAVRLAASWVRLPPSAGCVVAGHDGLAVKLGGEERFIAFGAIRGAEGADTGVTLDLDGDAPLTLDLIPPEAAGGGPGAAPAERRRLHLLALVRDRLRARDPAPLGAGALLERKGRTLSRWRADLASLTGEQGGYRRAMLPREQVLAVLENGDAPGELRIGAALALTAGPGGAPGPGLDADTRARLRVAVETCVHQEVRTALREAVYGELDDETLDQATRAAPAAR
jgi:hypothetical protein